MKNSERLRILTELIDDLHYDNSFIVSRSNIIFLINGYKKYLTNKQMISKLKDENMKLKIRLLEMGEIS